jgi:antitoxin component YwqK of YwqJK toxin-antitoxin module
MNFFTLLITFFLVISSDALSSCDQRQTEAIKYSHRYITKDTTIKFLEQKDSCRYALISDTNYIEYILGSNNNGIPDGVSIEWYPQSWTEKVTSKKIKKREYLYKNGSLDGPYTFWNESGVKKNEGLYSNNVLTGIYKSYNDKGELESEKEYINGLLAENQANKITDNEPQEIAIEKHIKLKETRGVTKKIESSVSLPAAQSQIEEIAAKYCWSNKQYPENIEQICEPCGIDNTKLFDWCKKTEKYQCESSKFYTVSFTCTSSGGYDTLDVNNKEQDKKVVDEKEMKLKEAKEKKLAKEKFDHENKFEREKIEKEKKESLEKINAAKIKCTNLGYIKGSDKFNKCVLELFQ